MLHRMTLCERVDLTWLFGLPLLPIIFPGATCWELSGKHLFATNAGCVICFCIIPWEISFQDKLIVREEENGLSFSSSLNLLNVSGKWPHSISVRKSWWMQSAVFNMYKRKKKNCLPLVTGYNNKKIKINDKIKDILQSWVSSQNFIHLPYPVFMFLAYSPIS